MQDLDVLHISKNFIVINKEYDVFINNEDPTKTVCNQRLYMKGISCLQNDSFQFTFSEIFGEATMY